MARLIGALIALTLAGAAHAQTTTCQTNRYSGQTTCQTTPAPAVAAPPAYSGGGTGALGLILMARQANKDRVIQKNVTDMIRAGDCDNAVNAALTAGKMELAAQARAICKPVAEPYSSAP